MTLKTPAGEPVAEAVVTIRPAAGTPAPKPVGPYLMSQHNIAFDPLVLVVPAGAEVTFPNLDNVRHHVYSFSPAHPFELKLYSHEQERKVTFDKAGIIAIGCNIHDQMVGFIDVVDTPYFAKTDAKGQAKIAGVPAGEATVTIWQPYLKAPQNKMEVKTAFAASGMVSAEIAVDVRRPAAMAMHGH